MRKLVSDGYPAQNILGCDLRHEFIDFGHELYKDAQTCGIHFLAGNIFDLETTAAQADATQELSKVDNLRQLVGRVTHFYSGAVFHLFDEEKQYQMAIRVAKLVKHTPGTIIFGRHQGLKEEGMLPSEEYPLVEFRAFRIISSLA